MDATPPRSQRAIDWIAEIDRIVARSERQWVDFRRYLHQHPELSDQEFATTDELTRRFESLGLPVHAMDERRGLLCDLVSESPDPLPRLALRGDIDALPIGDEKVVDYRSCRVGVMHACGHDVHAAIVFAAMSILRQLQQAGKLPWPIAVRALLQPSEEVASGARYMIHRHALRDAAAVLALHVDPTRRLGCIGLRSGTLTANCDGFRVVCHGSGGHGARPHLTRDPIDAATRWVQSAYRRIDRVSDPADTVVISVGRISGGHSFNVIPDTAELEGTLRTLTPASRSRVLEAIEDICEGVGRETGCRIDFQLQMSAPAVINDHAMTDLLHRATVAVVGAEAIEAIDVPSMGSEDFSYYLEHVPGAMMRLGVAGDQVGHAPLHTALFDVDERAIAIGAKVFAAAAVLYFAPDQGAHD